MAYVFPKENNPYWPLPPDYATLTKQGQRLARVNACKMTGRPDLDVAAWAFFREQYLIPDPLSWYKTGYIPSPVSHYKWIHAWEKYPLLVHAAPRGTSKTTVNLEHILRKIVCLPNWEAVLFLATNAFVSDRLGRLMWQVENNPRLIDDFGKMRDRGGLWNRGSVMELRNGSRVKAFPIKGASLGTRPSGLIVLDDVEKSDDQIITPTETRELMREFFFNAVYPMAQSPGHKIPIRVIGTLYNRRMYIYWLASTDDPRIKGRWKQLLMEIDDMEWEVFDKKWQEEKIKEIGQANFDAQYRNKPGTASSKMLTVHPQLCTYSLENEDGAALTEPFASSATILTHQLTGWTKTTEKEKPQPTYQPCRRPWREVVGGMRRFITVDWAPTTSPDSDYSVVHVLGLENTEAHRDTLYSLDIWWDRVRPEELTRVIYQMAKRWGVSLVGVEQYPVQKDYIQQVQDTLPGMYGKGDFVPRIMPIKFPPHVSKEMKIMGLEWRFVQFRVKLPSDRNLRNKGYERLYYEVENATEDGALLDHDDCVDTLAMSLAMGSPHKAAGPDTVPSADPIKLLRDGVYTHESTGRSVLDGINSSEIPEDVLWKMRQKKYEELEEVYGEEWDHLLAPYGYMNLPPALLEELRHGL